MKLEPNLKPEETRLASQFVESLKRDHWKANGWLKARVTGIPLPNLTHEERLSLIREPFPISQRIPGKSWAGVLIEPFDPYTYNTGQRRGRARSTHYGLDDPSGLTYASLEDLVDAVE